MIKGIAKRMFILKNMKSEIFDEAYFIMKEDIVERMPADDADMVKEASRIIDENDIFIREKYVSKTPAIKPFAAFVAGVCAAIAGIMLIYVIFG